MAKELYIYSGIYSHNIEEANKQLSKVEDSEELLVRLNSPGGEVNAGFAFLSKLSERKAKTNAIIDGQVASMAAFLLPFFDKVTANDTSELMFHKAAYQSWYEPTAEELASLKRTNEKFKEKMTAKVTGKLGAEDFLNKLFEADVRNDVELTPSEALDLGIVDEVRTIDVKAYDGMQLIALAENGKLITAVKEQTNNTSTNNNHIMTLEEFKAKEPALFAEITGNGKTQGVAEERDRVGAWMAFVEIDATTVSKGIKDGANLTQTAMAEFTAKGIAMARVADHTKDNSEDTKTDTSGATAEEIKLKAQKEEAQLALKKEGLIL